MIYPVAKTKEDFVKYWYDAQGFGAKTSYGYHEGNDINTRTGGNTDLGKPLYAVSNGIIKYYHNSSHPGSGFGRHMILECETPEGKRWFHYAHCDTMILEPTVVKLGDVIGTLGKSGTEYAHLHFSCFKTDPSLMWRKIDSYARTESELNENWIDALKFIEKYLVEDNNMAIDLKKRLIDSDWNILTEFESLRSLGLIHRDDSIQTQTQKWLAYDKAVDKRIFDAKEAGFNAGRQAERNRIAILLGIEFEGELPEDFDFTGWINTKEGMFEKFIKYLKTLWNNS